MDRNTLVTTIKILNANLIARIAHGGQVDKSGNPYFTHPIRVAELVTQIPLFATLDKEIQQDVIVASLLHDVLEDTPLVLDDLVSFGISERACGIVAGLTKKSEAMGYELGSEEYLEQIGSHRYFALVKLADVADNTDPERLKLLSNDEQERLVAKYTHTAQIIDTVIEGAIGWLNSIGRLTNLAQAN